jgi:hypothetical protein
MSAEAQAPYEIAKYLWDEAKRAAVARTYTPANPKRIGGRLMPRCEEGRCPLGVALRVMGREDGWGFCPHAPDENEVAELLGIDGDAITEAARAFIDDWDNGHIADLAAALGVAS